MKTVFSIVALGLASVVAANDYYNPPPPPVYPPPVVTKYEPGPVYKQSTTIYYTSTSTSLCPVTKVVTEGGKTYTTTYTTTTTVYVNVPTVVYQTVKKPDETKKVQELVTVTSTSLCPVTEVKTLPGGVVTLTHTSTTTYVKVIPKTEVQYTTLAPQTTNIITWDYQTSTTYCPVTVIQTVSGKPVTVVHTTTSLVVVKVNKTYVKTHYVHETVKTVETDYTTVEAGNTVVVGTTLTNTVLVTDEYTVTKTLEPLVTKATVYQPLTLATSVAVTQVVTRPSEVIATVPVNATTTPVQVSGNSAPTNRPIALAVAGGVAFIAAFV